MKILKNIIKKIKGPKEAYLKVDPISPSKGYVVATNPFSKNKPEYLILDKTSENVFIEGIKERAFFGNNNIKSIVTYSSVKIIEEYAFTSCKNLEEVRLLTPHITSISPGTFSECPSLSYVSLPPNLKHIKPKAFENCSSLREIILPEGLKTIEKDAFNGCNSLSSIVIPSTVTKIDSGAFGNCFNLIQITLNNPKVFLEPYAFGPGYKPSLVVEAPFPKDHLLDSPGVFFMKNINWNNTGPFVCTDKFTFDSIFKRETDNIL